MSLNAELRRSALYGGFCSFLDCDTIRDPKIVTPVRFLWAGYTRHCTTHGFPICEAKHFKLFIQAEPKITLKTIDTCPERVIRSVVQGICVNPDLIRVRRLTHVRA